MGTELNRHEWVDYAKGICIVAVVMMYAARDLHAETVRQGLAAAAEPGWLDHLVAFAKPFRMPDFFLLSGLFLDRVIDRPWRSYLDKKVVHYLYFFVLWSCIFFLFRWALGLIARDGQSVAYSALLMLVEPFAMLWFIQMLAVYFVVTRLTRQVPVWMMLGLASALQMANVWSDWSQVRHFGERYVYFYAGYAFAPAFFALAELARRHRMAAMIGLVAWAAVNGVLVHEGMASTRGIALVLGFAGAGAVIVSASLLRDLSWTTWLRYLGQHSIVVYLGFYLPMSAATVFVASRGWLGEPGSMALLITAFSIASAVIVHRYSGSGFAAFLFVRPQWARLAPQPADASGPGGRISSPESPSSAALSATRGSVLPPDPGR